MSPDLQMTWYSSPGAQSHAKGPHGWRKAWAAQGRDKKGESVYSCGVVQKRGHRAQGLIFVP